jgi:hypothetical protein
MLLRKVQGAAAGINQADAITAAVFAPQVGSGPHRTVETAGLILDVGVLRGLSHVAPPIGVSTHDWQHVSLIRVARFTGELSALALSVGQARVQQFHPTGSMATWPSLPSHSTMA